MPERNRYLRGMTVWVGFTQTAVPYRHEARHAGETKYPLCGARTGERRTVFGR
ncbi:MAG: hypothetical protein M3370_04470 [Actinomycetota bacterium]|nr:hypothetical protein [Actinomycetota bacterium]